MNQIGKFEQATQTRILQLFQNELGYTYLGNWKDQERSLPLEEDLLWNHLLKKGYPKSLSEKAVARLHSAASNVSAGLYEANKQVYKLLRYGVPVREELGQPKETVWLIDWNEPGKNDFGIAEEVSVKGKYNKRPDLVIYVNGIALGVIELKNSRKGLEFGIRQNLDNQKPEFIEKFFTTMQLVLAGNDTQGLRYGTIETPEKYYLKWKEDSAREFDYNIDKNLFQLFRKERMLELIHDFVVFDKGIKKLCRPNQFFGIKAGQQKIREREGGIFWHTQGSGKKPYNGLAHQMDPGACRQQQGADHHRPGGAG